MKKTEQLLEALELELLVLDGCTVTRGEAEVVTAGEVQSSFEISPSTDDDRIVYSIKTSHHFSNSEDESLANIEATFVAIYSNAGELTRSTELVERFGTTTVLFQVIPFVREFLASMTNRLGIPTFYLPFTRPQDRSAVRNSADT